MTIGTPDDICNDGVFNAMLSDFMSARQRVWLESHIFVGDACLSFKNLIWRQIAKH